MNNYSEEIWNIITRALSGEATREEEETFQDWIVSDPKNREFFQNLKSSWNREPEKASEKFFFDHKSGLTRLRGKLEQLDQKKSDIRLVKTTRPTKRKRRQQNWVLAAVIMLAAFLSVFGGLHLLDQADDITGNYATYVTSDVEQRIITLSDGSVVRLNRNSRVEVNDKSGSVREVNLQGEAFFDVTSDPGRPFIIYTTDAVVEVLGTSFSVKESDEVMVAVRDGVVSLRNRENDIKSAARLTEGQLGILSSIGDEVKIEDANIENYLSWMNGYMQFENMPFDQVILQLERIFGDRHVVDDTDIESINLTVYTEKIDKNEVLDAISTALSISYQEKEGAIYWSELTE